MPSTFAQRFKEAVKDRKLSLRELGRRTGATGATFSNWQNEVTNPDNIGAELLRAVSSELGVRPEWLLRGEAPKHPQSYSVGEMPAVYGAEPASADTRDVPIVSWVQAGHGAEAVDPYPRGQGEGHIGVDAETAKGMSRVAFALRIEGDSMLEEFQPGDLVIVDPEVRPLPGDFVVAKLDDDSKATFKKYRARGRSAAGYEVFELVPLNVDYPTITVDEMRPGRVIATMIEHRRKRRRR